MSTDSSALSAPLDAINLAGAALVAEGERLGAAASGLRDEGLQRLRGAFQEWASVLIYFNEKEGEIASKLRVDDNRRSSEKDAVIETILAFLGDEVASLMDRLQDVLAVLDEEIGSGGVIERTRQHLEGRLLALRVAQEDHRDHMEAIVLPLLRSRLGERRQLELVRGVLVDTLSDDPYWVLSWVAKRLDPRDWQAVLGLDPEFAKASSPTGQ